MWFPAHPTKTEIEKAVDALGEEGEVTLEPVTIKKSADRVTVITPLGQWSAPARRTSTKVITREAARLAGEWVQAVIDGLLEIERTGKELATTEATADTLRSRRVEEAKHLYALGVTAYRISKFAGASEAAVGRWFRRGGGDS